jgi:hypothetical protein
LLGFLFFYSIDVAANTPNSNQPLIDPEHNAWIELSNNVAYKPNPPSEYIPPPPVRPRTGNYCSCVNYVKALTGFSQSIGYARNWPINSSTPFVGAVVVTSEGPYGHVAVITAITEDGFLILDEANYSPCRHTTGRHLSVDSPLILGYWVKIINPTPQ